MPTDSPTGMIDSRDMEERKDRLVTARPFYRIRALRAKDAADQALALFFAAVHNEVAGRTELHAIANFERHAERQMRADAALFGIDNQIAFYQSCGKQTPT